MSRNHLNSPSHSSLRPGAGVGDPAPHTVCSPSTVCFGYTPVSIPTAQQRHRGPACVVTPQGCGRLAPGTGRGPQRGVGTGDLYAGSSPASLTQGSGSGTAVGTESRQQRTPTSRGPIPAAGVGGSSSPSRQSACSNCGFSSRTRSEIRINCVLIRK